MLRYISSPFKWFFKLEAASGLVLLISAKIALTSKTKPLAASSLKNHLNGEEIYLIIIYFIKKKKKREISIID